MNVRPFALTLAVYLPTTFSAGCGGAGSTSSAPTATQDTSYVAAYKAAAWGSTMTVTFPSTCEMTVTATGKPNYTPNPWYLAPATAGETVVAYTASTNMGLALISYASVAPALQGSSATIDICPAKAASSTATSLGAIGYLISGTAMFNPFEANASTAAVADNASYTFTDANRVSQTAHFLDQCDTHPNSTTWHAHGNPACVTAQVDTATGASHIIGVALDGYPIYGGRDINGAVITTSQLDACNGITSATPEFPAGAYHYVLPLGVTTKYASINCYTGTVNGKTVAAARKLACNMNTMMAAMHAAEHAAGPEKKQPLAVPAEDHAVKGM